MDDQDVTIRGLEIGAAIRARLHTLGVTSAQVATHLGWAPSKLSRVLTGHRPVSDHDIAKLIGYCGVHHPHADYLLRLAADRHRNDPLTLPATTSTLIDYHELSTESTAYHRDSVPRELCVPPRPNYRREEHRAHYLTETALQHLNDPGTQLPEILRHCTRPSVSIRVLGTPVAVESFVLLRFYDLHPIVHIQTSALHIYLETTDDIARYANHLTELDATAWDEQRSRAALTALAANHTARIPEVAAHERTVAS